MRIFSRSLVILGLTCTLCFCLQHASASEDTPPPQKTDRFVFSDSIIVHAEKPPSPQAIFDIPAFVTEIHLDDEPRLKILPEILSGTVGITVKDFGGLGQLSTVSIRGSNSNQVLILLDGIRLNDPSQSGVNLANISLANIDTIQVLRGADSAVYGDGAFGGVVNLLTRRDASTSPRLDGRVTYGSFDTLDAEIGASTVLDRHRLNLTVFRRHSDGDFSFTNDRGTPENDGDDFTDIRTNNQATSWGGNLSWRFESDTHWACGGTLDAFGADKGSPGIITFPSEHATQQDQRLSGTLRIDRSDLEWLSSSIMLEVSGTRATLLFEDPEGEQIGVPIRTDRTSDSLMSRSSWRFLHPYGSGSVSMEYARDSLNDPDREPISRTIGSLAIRDDVSLFDERLWISPAIRLDDVSNLDYHISPRIGCRAVVNDHLSLRTNFGSAFRSPSFDELYLDLGFITGNPDLKPETARSFDAGLTWESHRVNLMASYFQTDSRDLIQYVLVSGYRYKPFNIGRARSRGIECSAACNLGAGFNVSTAYTWMEATDRTADPNYRGRFIPGKPEHELFSRLDWAMSRYAAFFEWRYMSGNYLTRANTNKLDARDTMNLGFSVGVMDHLKLGVELRNALNSEVVDVRGFPLPPRMITGTLSVRL